MNNFHDNLPPGTVTDIEVEPEIELDFPPPPPPTMFEPETEPEKKGKIELGGLSMEEIKAMIKDELRAEIRAEVKAELMSHRTTGSTNPKPEVQIPETMNQSKPDVRPLPKRKAEQKKDPS